jgi:broad specificity phosphatase PhoE
MMFAAALRRGTGMSGGEAAANCEADRPEIWLARHGETEWSHTMRHTGRTDIELTEDGRQQAQLLRHRLEGRSFARVITSPLSRAVETCSLAGLGDAAERSQALLEWDYGEYEGLTTGQIRERRPGWVLWRDGCPGGENAADVGARVDPLVAELRDTGGNVALFAHGHVLRVLAARWLGLEPQAGALLALSTGTLSVLGWERETAVVRCWNVPP